MECVICFDDVRRGCRLACGHAFHEPCLREWFMKSEHGDCPTCRRRIYVRKRPGLVESWMDERLDARKEEIMWEVVTDILEEIPEDMLDVIPLLIGDVQRTFHRIKDFFHYGDDLYDALEDPFMIHSMLISTLMPWAPASHPSPYDHPPPEIVAFAAREPGG